MSVKALRKAIQLRKVTRKAIDVGDDRAMCEWNRRADAAYAALDPFDAIQYIKWAFDSLRPSDAAEFGRLFESLGKP